MINLALPGNPRYQPKSLQGIFGYDNLFRPVGEVELANLEAMHLLGTIPDDDWRLLTPEVREKVLNITTTEVDQVERDVTKHDIRAWILIAKDLMDPRIGRWMHVMLTSYDPLETARCLQYQRCFNQVTGPTLREVISLLADMVEENANVLQIGRTHLQAALPITVGFWLATILHRLVYNYQEMKRNADALVGKISGAVGAHNAQVGLGLGTQHEDLVLEILGVKKAPITTQILPPEPLAYFLYSAIQACGALGQFGRDARNLMRTEIAEVEEDFSSRQAGSSTMAHKRNPTNFEGLEGEWLKNKAELYKVLEGTISDLQRDLVASRLYRDYPVILVNLQTQLESLTRKGGESKLPFLKRIRIDTNRCQMNFDAVSNVILSEPLYIALQMYGYERDAHELVNHQIVPLAQKQNINLVQALGQIVEENSELENVWNNIPPQIRSLLESPWEYTGNAAEAAMNIVAEAREIV